MLTVIRAFCLWSRLKLSNRDSRMNLPFLRVDRDDMQDVQSSSALKVAGKVKKAA